MNNIFKHVLVPYNGTSGSYKAFIKGVMLSEIIKSKITILTCLEERSTFGLFKTKTNRQEFEKEQKLVMQKHKELEKFANQHGVPTHFKIIKNDMASSAIIEFAEKNNVDLIIMGTKELTPYEKIHYPSTIGDISKSFHGAVLILN